MNSVPLEKPEDRLRDLHPAFGCKSAEQMVSHPARWQGGHTFRLRQPSRLPAFSRHYFPGDPVKLIDWKAYARTDQLLVREDRRIAAGAVLICIDIGDSMLWPHPPLLASLGRAVPTKFEIAVRIALHLCYQSICLGDPVALVPWDSSGTTPRAMNSIPCPSTAEIVQLFDSMTAQGFTRELFCRRLHPWQEGRRYELAYLISDWLGHTALPWVATQSRKPRTILVMSSLENDLAWVNDGYCYFDDSSEKKEYLGGELRTSEDYRAAVNDWQRRISGETARLGGCFQTVTDETSITVYQKELTVTDR